jgi:branched-chain amino acid transport system permease protein
MATSMSEVAANATDELVPAAWRWPLFIGAAAIAVVLPFVVKNFVIFQITLAVIYAIAILGLNLLTGFNGQFSLGHNAFYAIGAYTAAIMMEHGDIAYYWTLPAAGVVCLVSGFLFGLPALRLEGIYLVLATFALAIATPQLLKASFLEHWTGGVQGIVVEKPDAPFGLPLNADQWLYFFTLGVAIVLYVCAVNLVASRTGRALVAIRDHPVAARAMGINVAFYKSLTFGVSALYAGVAGALGAVAIQFVAPDSFTLALAVALFVGMVVGGVGSIAGTLFGGAFVLFVPNIAEHISKGLEGAVYGLILILLIYAMPAGAAGLVRWLTHRSVPKLVPLNSALRAIGFFRRESGRTAVARTNHKAVPGGHLEGGSDEQTCDAGLVRRRDRGDFDHGTGPEEIRSRSE